MDDLSVRELVKQQSKRVDVRHVPVARRFRRVDMLRSHIPERPHAARRRLLALLRLRDSKVAHLCMRPAPVQKHVGGVDVAMHVALTVQKVQPFRNIDRKLHHNGPRFINLARVEQEVVQRATVHVFEHETELSHGEESGAVKRADARVAQRGQDLCLAHKLFDHLVVLRLGQRLHAPHATKRTQLKLSSITTTQGVCCGVSKPGVLACIVCPKARLRRYSTLAATAEPSHVALYTRAKPLPQPGMGGTDHRALGRSRLSSTPLADALVQLDCVRSEHVPAKSRVRQARRWRFRLTRSCCLRGTRLEGVSTYIPEVITGASEGVVELATAAAPPADASAMGAVRKGDDGLPTAGAFALAGDCTEAISTGTQLSDDSVGTGVPSWSAKG
eukprot:3675107-Prymnesium_polylepis.3